MGCTNLRIKQIGTAVKDRWSVKAFTADMLKTGNGSSADGVHGRFRKELDQVRRVRPIQGLVPVSFDGVF